MPVETFNATNGAWVVPQTAALEAWLVSAGAGGSGNDDPTGGSSGQQGGNGGASEIKRGATQLLTAPGGQTIIGWQGSSVWTGGSAAGTGGFRGGYPVINDNGSNADADRGGGGGGAGSGGAGADGSKSNTVRAAGGTGTYPGGRGACAPVKSGDTGLAEQPGAGGRNSGTAGNNNSCYSGGGGGSAYLAALAVTPGETLAMNIGAGGVGRGNEATIHGAAGRIVVSYTLLPAGKFRDPGALARIRTVRRSLVRMTGRPFTRQELWNMLHECEWFLPARQPISEFPTFTMADLKHLLKHMEPLVR